MMILRNAQIEALYRDARERFERDMVRMLRVRQAEKTREMSDVQLRAVITVGIDKAVGYGLRVYDDIRSFLNLSILLGSDFDTSPETEWIGEILRDESLDGEEKMLWIEDGLEARR